MGIIRKKREDALIQFQQLLNKGELTAIIRWKNYSLSVDAVKLSKPLCRLCKDITESKRQRVADQYV
jgi:hypothetical protein